MTNRISLFCLCFVAPFVAASDGSLNNRIENEFAFRPLPQPVSGIELGSLIKPGHEELGAFLPDSLRDQLQNAATTTWELISVSPQFELGEVGELITLERQLTQKCSKAKVIALNGNVRKISLDTTVGDRLLKGYSTLLGGAEVLMEDGQEFPVSWVVIAETLSFEVSVRGCDDDNLAMDLAENVGNLVWGYRGATPSRGMNATGKNFYMELLQLFELKEIAMDRTLLISEITTNPAGMEVGWIDRIRAARRDAKTLPDHKFRWLGRTPIGEQRLWPGRFYFRLRNQDSNETLVRDLTLSDEGHTLELHLQGVKP